MDFNFKKLTSDAAAVFNRAVQFTEEKLGKAEKTELDAQFETLLLRADKTEDYTKRILSCIEGYLQPNPTLRMEEVFYEKLELRKEHRMNNLEYLGQAMTEAGNEFNPGTAYGGTLLKVGATQYKLGAAERDFIQTSAANVLTPLKRFLEGDMKTIAKERKILMNKRLDLDACKNRLKKAKTMEGQSNTKGGLTVEQAEADLRVAQSEFDKQSEILKLLLEGIQTAHNNHLKCLRDFVEAQMAFYAQCHQHMADLQRELSGALSSDSGLHLYSGMPGANHQNQQKQHEPGQPSSSPYVLSLPQHMGTGSSGLVHNDFGAGTTDNKNVSMFSSGATTVDHADMGTKRAKVLFDYEAVNPNEISVRKDDALIVYRLPGLDPEYVMAEKGNQRGRIPLSYLEIV